jgi:hypothetical protein
MNSENKNQDRPQSETTKSSLLDHEQPLGDGGERGKTWAPPEGQQGISNRPDDEDAAATAEDKEAEDDDDDEDDEETEGADGDEIDLNDLEPDPSMQ